MKHSFGRVIGFCSFPLVILAGYPAPGQDLPGAEPDRITLERISEVEAVIEYHNSADRSSGQHPPRRTLSDDHISLLEVDVVLQIGNDTDPRETLTVTPPPGWVAVPRDYIQVPDGETGVIHLILEIEHLGF